ncbi:MAG: hypothetical protein WCS65_09520 [Verrucomicrobiae bacterium]
MTPPTLTQLDIHIAYQAVRSLIGRTYRTRHEWNKDRAHNPAIPGMAATIRALIRDEIATARRLRAMAAL